MCCYIQLCVIVKKKLIMQLFKPSDTTLFTFIFFSLRTSNKTMIYIIVKNIDIYDNSDLQCLTLQAGMSPHIHFFYFNGYKTPIIPLRTVEEIVLPVMMDFKGFKSLNKRNREF